MNARSMVRRAPGLVAGLIIVGLAVWGCESRDVVTGTGSGPEVPRIPDISEETSRTQAYLYDPENPYTVTTVNRLLAHDDVDAMIVAFEQRGMELAREDCLVIEGVDSGRTTRVTFIGLTPRDRGLEEIGVLACFERGEQMAVAPGVFTSTLSRPGGQYLKLADGLWMNTGPVTPVRPSSEEATRWNPEQWSKFWECTMTYAPGPVSACFVGCLFVGPGYLQCTVACVSTQALSVVVRCATRVLMGGRMGSYDREAE